VRNCGESPCANAPHVHSDEGEHDEREQRASEAFHSLCIGCTVRALKFFGPAVS
jgi:hypothetical protein